MKNGAEMVFDGNWPNDLGGFAVCVSKRFMDFDARELFRKFPKKTTFSKTSNCKLRNWRGNKWASRTIRKRLGGENEC